MKRFCAVGVMAIGLTACQEPAISDIGTDQVKVVASVFMDKDKVLAEAQRGCALYKRQPVPLSVRNVGDYQKEYLFACKEP